MSSPRLTARIVRATFMNRYVITWSAAEAMLCLTGQTSPELAADIAAGKVELPVSQNYLKVIESRRRRSTGFEPFRKLPGAMGPFKYDRASVEEFRRTGEPQGPKVAPEKVRR